jgi:hypothetical protein
MHKKDKLLNFKISKIEQDAVTILKDNDIHIASFLRRMLRERAEQLKNEK